jgi:AGZA family xanthine/uracil permease-like MFS transporter
MAYIIIVNPKILEAAGIPFGPSMVATILSAFSEPWQWVFMQKGPSQLPLIWVNSWQTALGAIFIGGVLFTILTVLKIRSWLANAIPEGLKIGFVVGIGLFLTFIGLNVTGIVTLGVPGAPVRVGNFSDPRVILAVLGFLLIGFFMIRKIKGAILMGILIITFLSFFLKLEALPEQWISMPPGLSPIFLKLDIFGALSWGFFAVVLTVFVMDFVDTMGTLIGVSYRAGLLDEQGNLPDMEKPLLCDSLATVFASLLGTTTTGTYIESATGIEEGGRSGLTRPLLRSLCYENSPLCLWPGPHHCRDAHALAHT